MYWWLGMWMGIVACVLGAAAISIPAQTMDWDIQTFLEWLKGAPEGWGPRLYRGWRAGRKWAGEMSSLVSSGVSLISSGVSLISSGVSLISSGKWKELAARAGSLKGSGKKVDASFYRGLYRSMAKSESGAKESFGNSL